VRAYAEPMVLGKPLVSVFLVSCLLLPTTGAEAQTRHIHDPAGDGMKGRALDITGITISNRDQAIVATISFVRVPAYGDLGLALQEHGDGKHEFLVVVGTTRSPRGDKTVFASVPRRHTCDGLGVAWSSAVDRVRIRIPARCIRHGDYGAVRGQVITEIGSDADVAPKTASGRWRWTRWIARG
jgi:hypothetical protein